MPILKQMTLFEQVGIASNNSWFSKALEVLGISEKPAWPDDFGDAIIKWNSKNKRKPIRVLSLFSGAGGIDIGFHDAGFQIVECNEIEKNFAATLLENSQANRLLSDSNIICLDIRKYDPEPDNIDFIIGGPPCQTFSAAGARAAGVNGTDDERGNLFKEYVRILKKIKPRGFLFENVYRIVGAQGGKPWKEIRKAFQDVGYKLYWRVIDAADYGVPQFRERLIIVGLKEGTYKFPFPTHGPDSTDQRGYYTAGKAVDGLASKISVFKLGGRHGHLLNDIPPGLNYSFYTEKLGHPKPIFGWRSKFSDYLYKADHGTPVRTIKAQGGQYTGPFHWENRPFTIEELKRLQTFPDNYKIVGNRQNTIHQIGNSVPPQLARILGLSILQQVFDISLPFEIDLMPDSFKLGFRARKRDVTKIYAQKAAQAISCLPKDEVKKKYVGERIGYVRVTDDFQLILSSKSDSADYFIQYTAQNDEWILKLQDIQADKHTIKKYELKIQSNDSLLATQGIKTIKMQSYSNNKRSILALWKYLEKIVKDHCHKDDLVQLFGYYHYRQNYIVNMKLFDDSLMDKPFWKVLSQVSAGNSISKILHIAELSNCYGVPQETLILVLKELKKIGFEIRNDKTNKQISNNMILIPYVFPSLNERSLQRFTEL
ncbi:DNA cytosine methyltransferase [Desulfobacula phenolica]|uniref:Cytosine-specific methyltransferase n=1 Tax=Desulfobacula phenolica TaxID=90732 RepID=A0A1H2JJN4_9BACT|nr:DNA cytosine methyltransferase [Desulfobacula phenolica]SDU56689.1 DNA (cytosine-5)-methyltransferase 1 [Desulfobacula phenolica]